MAVPPTRRPGASRPAQYLLFGGYVVAVLGAVAGLILLVTAWADPAGHAQLRARATDLTAPLSTLAADATVGVRGAGQAVGDWWRAGAQNAALRQELEDGRTVAVEAAAIRAENQRLKRLLRVVERDGAPVAVTRLVASSPAALRRLAVLPVGRSSGVRPDQPVRGPVGLVGRVLETGSLSARVLLITDTASVVPVRRASDDLDAVAAGDGAGGLEIRPLSTRRVVLRPGDLFITNGIGGVYPPNIPVAVVRRTATDRAAARPLADPSLSDPILVLPVYEPAVAFAPPVPVAEGAE